MTARFVRALSPLQQRAVPVVLASRSAAEAAERLGCSERTVRRWLTDEAFTEAVKDAGRAAARQAAASLLGAQRRAVSALVAALDDPAGAVRVRAASVLLEAGRLAVGDDLAERVEALERRDGRWSGMHVV